MKRTLRERKGSAAIVQAAAPRKRHAITSTRSASIKALNQHNTTTSPLLRLPPEIRTQIFRLLIGDRFIHILYMATSPSPGFRYCVCTAAQSEDEAYNDFTNGYSNIPSLQDPQYYVPPFKQRHAHCKHWDREDGRFFADCDRFNWRDIPVVDRPRNLLSLAPLLLCRQMYEEASFLLWTTSTFSFEDPITLRMFMSGRNFVQRKQLTAIHIDTQWELEPLEDWAKLMTPTFVKGFKGLRTLHATYDQNFRRISSLQLGRVALSTRDEVIKPSDDIKGPVKIMRVLPLQHVTVIIADDADPVLNFPTNKFRWTLAQKREVADLLRRKLLDPDGHKLTADQLQAETAEARKLESISRG